MTGRPSILVPIRMLEGESVPEGVPELLANAHVVLLGFHVIPDQTAPGQAQMQFEDRATARLEEYEEIFKEAGASVERRLVFTHDGQKTIDRMITEHDCMAVLVPNATGPIEDILVAVRGAVGVDRLARVVAGLFGNSGAGVTLYHVASAAETDDDIQTLLGEVADRLAEFGMDASTIETRIDRDRDTLDAIVNVAETFDTVVMGETDPSLATFVFGMPADQVASRFLGPVLVVQHEPAPDDADEDEDENEEEQGA